jgi:hypothetical protein
MEYDAVLGDDTKNKIKKINDSYLNCDKKGIFFVTNNDFYDGIEAHYFLCEIDYFLNNFWNVTCEQDYINFLETEFGNRDFLIMERFMYENVKKLNHDEIYVKDGFSTEFDSTLWNMKQTRIYNDKKYKECLTKFYLKRDHPDEIVIYSKNVKSEPDFRRIVVKFNDGVPS